MISDVLDRLCVDPDVISECTNVNAGSVLVWNGLLRLP